MVKRYNSIFEFPHVCEVQCLVMLSLKLWSVTYLFVCVLVALDADDVRDRSVSVSVVLNVFSAGRGLVLKVGGLVDTSGDGSSGGLHGGSRVGGGVDILACDAWDVTLVSFSQ